MNTTRRQDATLPIESFGATIKAQAQGSESRASPDTTDGMESDRNTAGEVDKRWLTSPDPPRQSPFWSAPRTSLPVRLDLITAIGAYACARALSLIGFGPSGALHSSRCGGRITSKKNLSVG